MPKKTFEAWVNEVHKYLDLVGLSIDDLPDCPYRDWYDDGTSPKAAAGRAIRRAGDLR